MLSTQFSRLPPQSHGPLLPQAFRRKQQSFVNAVARFDADNARLLQPRFGALSNAHGQYRITVGEQLHEAAFMQIIFLADILSPALPQARARLQKLHLLASHLVDMKLLRMAVMQIYQLLIFRGNRDTIYACCNRNRLHRLFVKTIL